MEWIQDYETGLADIDVQHRYLFALVQRVQPLDDVVDRVELHLIANELVRFAKCHFGYEERLMTMYGYLDSARHLAEHAKLLDEVQTFQNDQEIEARRLALFICNWLVAHTMLEDRQLAEHVVPIRARALGMSPTDFVEGVKLHRPNSYFSTIANEAPESLAVNNLTPRP
jgi:hemerythrin